MDALGIVQQVLEALIGFTSILANSLVLVSLYRIRATRTPTDCLIASLSSADLLVGALGIPCVIAGNLGLPHNFSACVVTTCVIIVMTQISIFSLLLVALERFAAVVAPLFHWRHSSGKTVAIGIALAWTSAILLGCIPVFGWHKPEPIYMNSTDFVCTFVGVIDMRYMVLFNFFGCVLTPLVIIYAIYGYIYQFIRRKLKAQRLPGDLQQAEAAEKPSSTNLKKESSVTKRIFLILVSFSLCWLPLHIMNCLSMFAGLFYFPAVMVAIFLSHANSAINPFLYALANPRIMSALKRTLGIRSGAAVGIEPTHVKVHTIAVVNGSP